MPTSDTPTWQESIEYSVRMYILYALLLMLYAEATDAGN